MSRNKNQKESMNLNTISQHGHHQPPATSPNPVESSQTAYSADFGHAVVIGCSIAGLTAAQVLTGYFGHVTIVERDQLPNGPDFRRGVPQARHAHILLPRGHKILERYLPGLVDELLAEGAVAVDASRDIAIFEEEAWRTSSAYTTNVSINFSRPLLENALHRRVADHPRVKIMQGYEAVGLLADEQNQRVIGLKLRDRHSAKSISTALAADLIVDATGRQSHAPQWLESLGYTPPEEWHVNTFVGYASRLYQIPPTVSDTWKTLLVRPTPPDGTRGGIIVAAENDHWYVTLIGVAGDYPPTDPEAFLAFARSLPTPRLYEAIKEATPLTEPAGYRITDNRVRRYDKLPRYLEGFLVCGDAAFALNPVYAQGMTAAITGSQALDQALQAQGQQADLTGLAGAFQRRLSQTVGHLWHAATKQEWDWDVTEVTDNTDKEMK
ncbi:MAG TPA: FAD-dependent monooxygenase [Anaerolineae bacterium]